VRGQGLAEWWWRGQNPFFRLLHHHSELLSGRTTFTSFSYNMFTAEQDRSHLQLALEQAHKSLSEGGIPIGFDPPLICHLED
jgi:hypothetical protein